MQKFSALIQTENRYTYLEIPFDPREVFDIAKGTIYVNCQIDKIASRSKLLSRGGKNYWLVLNQSFMKKLDKVAGDKVEVSMEKEKKDIQSKERVYSTSKMSALEAIYQRRSIRRFKEQRISDQDLETILHAGFCAPSAHNKRPWHFIVVRDQAMLEQFSNLNPYTKMLANADTAIVVCADENLQSTLDFLYEDSAAAIQNILLAVHALGLGAVWCGMKRNSDHFKKMTQLCELPDKIIPVGLIALGYPDEEKVGKDRYDENCVHYEKWK